LIIFGGREGDGKKRIVNDIFIFDTGRCTTYHLLNNYFMQYRKVNMVITKSR